MKQLIPNQFLFRFAFACQYAKNLPGKGGRVTPLENAHRLAFTGGMDGRPEFAKVWMGWNENGLGIAYEIPLKQQPLYGEAGRPKACDGLSLWLDTRDTRTIHRASRYCQRFTFTAHDGTPDGGPTAHRLAIHRALEEPPAVDMDAVQIARYALDDGEAVVENDAAKIRGYRLEVFLPATVLYGFDPDTNIRLGFFYRIRDKELGDQLLAAGPELPYWEDPSLWAALELLPA